MAVNLERFNRIIDITFIPKTGGFELLNLQSIRCPRNGMKPNIEINGTFGAARLLPVFNITIKNFYADFRSDQYAKIKVRAGYANNYATFEAEILSMYQETPGPEGTTVIQCQMGAITTTWMDATVSLNYENGTPLATIMNQIKTKLKATDIHWGTTAKTLKLEQPLQFDGSCRDAMAKVMEVFAAYNLAIFPRGQKLCAICLTEGDHVDEKELQYLSAPPQQNPGDEQGNWHTMITAPWMPDLMPGDELTIPLNSYIYKGFNVGGGKKKQKLVITEMSFHFGTRGGTNQMTCSGYINRK